ncbi:hypothetical protein KSP39_PZI000079 [Platanthera zijinensis]|uniref:Uncharacterized protein n=1 Tax=Platanthera zijinensis TaxID=2320716 RepID=A0AAP0C3V9_9ASPA
MGRYCSRSKSYSPRRYKTPAACIQNFSCLSVFNNDGELIIPSYMRRPAWMPENSVYAVGNHNQGLYLVVFSPKKSRFIRVDFMDKSIVEKNEIIIGI